MSKYPEHEKLKAQQRDVGLLGEFIDFTAEQGWELAVFHEYKYGDGQLQPIHKRPDEIIGLFLGIDPKKLELEKRAMLDEIRSTDEQRAKEAGS